jgi:hypothetical protein
MTSGIHISMKTTHQVQWILSTHASCWSSMWVAVTTHSTICDATAPFHWEVACSTSILFLFFVICRMFSLLSCRLPSKMAAFVQMADITLIHCVASVTDKPWSSKALLQHKASACVLFWNISNVKVCLSNTAISSLKNNLLNFTVLLHCHSEFFVFVERTTSRVRWTVMDVTCVLMSSLMCYSLFVCVFIAQARILLH